MPRVIALFRTIQVHPSRKAGITLRQFSWLVLQSNGRLAESDLAKARGKGRVGLALDESGLVGGSGGLSQFRPSEVPKTAFGGVSS